MNSWGLKAATVSAVTKVEAGECASHTTEILLNYTHPKFTIPYFDSIQASMKNWFLTENATHAVNYE